MRFQGWLGMAGVVAAGMVLGACSTTETKKAEVAQTTTAAKPAPASDPRKVATVDVARDPLNDPNSPLAKRSVYFDFDSYVVKSEYGNLVQSHGAYLKAHHEHKILIQGNTDERGTAEYNLALGQKRAEALRKSLVLVGVPESQIEAVSLGKEKPKAMGHDEAAWAQNRRDDILY